MPSPRLPPSLLRRSALFGVLALALAGCRLYGDPIAATLVDRDGAALGPVTIDLVADLSPHARDHGIAVTLPDGSRFAGSLTDRIEERLIGRFGGGPDGDADGPEIILIRRSTGGTLYGSADSTVALRCDLRYRDPVRGIEAGGRGLCHTNDGRRFDLVL